MLHWNAICIQTFTNVAFTTVQWFWLKGAVQIFTDWPAQTTSSTFPLRQSSLWNAAECSSFFLFFFSKSYKKSTGQGRTQHFNISHRKCRQKCSCEKKAWARCWLCLQSSEMHVRGVMQIQGCWGKHRPGLFQRIKRRSDTVKAVGWRMLLILHFLFFFFYISLAANYSCHTDFDSTSTTLKMKKNKKKKFKKISILIQKHFTKYV